MTSSKQYRLRQKAGLCILFATSASVLAQVIPEPEYTARYRLTFEADWSVQTHPSSFPPDPHFSPLIGATHNAETHLWRLGEPATAGVQNMAETGATSTLQQEVEALIEQGLAGEVVSGGGIETSPDTISLEFELSQDHPLVSVTSMIAPSPDWFVGVDSLSLREDGSWRDQVIIELQAIDAGTDSGANYTSANAPTNPAEGIFRPTSTPFADGVSLGRFNFELLSVQGHLPIRGYLSGLFFDPARDGEGLNISVDSVNENTLMTVIWYTFDQGAPLWLIGVAELDPNADEATVEMLIPAGANFGADFNPADVDLQSWGTLTVRFPACDRLSVSWDGGPEFGNGQLEHQRLLGVGGFNCP